MQNRKLGRGIAGALAALVLTAGVALALETLSVAVPDTGSWVSTAVVLVDKDGATVFADRPENGGSGDTEFRVVFDEATETFAINGGAPVPYAPGGIYHVIAAAREIGGVWTVDIEVRDDAGNLLAVELGHAMGGAPTQVTATAADVIDLRCE